MSVRATQSLHILSKIKRKENSNSNLQVQLMFIHMMLMSEKARPKQSTEFEGAWILLIKFQKFL